MNKSLIAAAVLASLAATAQATPDWKPETPAPAPAPASTSSAGAGSTSTSGASSSSGSSSNSGATSISGASPTQIASPVASSQGQVVGYTGPSSSSASASPVVTASPSAAGGTSHATGAATVGPIMVAPQQGTQQNTQQISADRSITLMFPQPVAGVASASNCVIAGNRAGALGWNFGSFTTPHGYSEPVCALRAMAQEADAACQFRTAAEYRAEAAAVLLKRRAAPVGEHVQDLTPEQCLMLRQPRIVLPPAPVIAPVTNVEQNAALQAEATQLVPPPAAPARRPQAAPTPAPQVCSGQAVQQCTPAR